MVEGEHHAALVHFPIALLPAALLYDLLALATEQRWVASRASLLWVSATSQDEGFHLHRKVGRDRHQL